MKRDLKIVLLIIVLSSSILSAEDSDKQHSDSNSHEDYVMKAPLQSELTEVYKGGKKVGKKAGKSTKNFFCSELHWSFFCKGDD